MSKPRILCLHGRGLNSVYFRGQLLGLIRRNPDLDFYFLQGHLPSEVAPEALGAWQVALKPQERAEPANRWKAGHDAAEGLEHVWEAACAESRQNGPFYAALGFSQGANVAAALLAKQAAGDRCCYTRDAKPPVAWRFFLARHWFARSLPGAIQIFSPRLCPRELRTAHPST
eukprot:symbB.v1.2.012759.t1/scaffold889.1/size154925/6